METEEKERQKTEEKKEEEAQKQWDMERQRADQAESVAEKAREEARTYAEELGETKTKLQYMESQLAEFQKQTQAEKDALVEMDSGLIDPNVISNVQKLNARDAAFAKEVEELRKELTELKTERQERQRQDAIAKAREDVLSKCDEQFGAKYRNDALKLADKLVDSGDVEQPNDKFSGYMLMLDCYKKVSEKDKSKEKTSVSVDSGSGGVSHTTKTRKTGTRAEVLADMKKDKSWLTG